MSTVRRVAAIVRADVLIRFRRVSTLVTFLLLSGFAYLWIPSPSSGKALMQIGNQRVLYNSAAIGMATALLAVIFIGLASFYVVSNAVRRDVQSGCGFVLAATPVRSGEYIVGKFLGNVIFLSAFVGGFMLTSMAMQIVRGEAPLEPVVFATQYLLLVPPAIVFVSAIAITFESIPFLAGRFGDVLYFFVWAGSIGVVASSMEQGGGPNWIACFDVSGMGTMLQQMHGTSLEKGLSIGSSKFDPRHGLVVFHGLHASPLALLQRLAATLLTLPLLGVARLAFHRFDPVRVKSAGRARRGGWLGRINGWSRPATRLFAVLLHPASGLLGASRIDAWLVLASQPVTAVLMVVALLMTAAAPIATLASQALPIVFLIAGVCLADIATRERAAGTLTLTYVVPRLREQFVWWKFLTAFAIALGFTAVAILRLALWRPQAAMLLVIGVLFLSAAATALGIISGNPKTFLLLFLTFWYVVVNDRGATPWLDPAGFYGRATPLTGAAYLLVAGALLALTEIRHRMTLEA